MPCFSYFCITHFLSLVSLLYVSCPTCATFLLLAPVCLSSFSDSPSLSVIVSLFHCFLPAFPYKPVLLTSRSLPNLLPSSPSHFSFSNCPNWIWAHYFLLVISHCKFLEFALAQPLSHSFPPLSVSPTFPYSLQKPPIPALVLPPYYCIAFLCITTTVHCETYKVSKYPSTARHSIRN